MDESVEKPPAVRPGDRARLAAEYAAIEAALKQSRRGRRFLEQHAKRHRAADTETVLQGLARVEVAIGKLTRKAAMPGSASAGEPIAAAAPASLPKLEGWLDEAAIALDGLGADIRQNSAAILEAAEAIGDLAWTLREKGVSGDGAGELAEALEARAKEIVGACRGQEQAASQAGTALACLEAIQTLVQGGKAEAAPRRAVSASPARSARPEASAAGGGASPAQAEAAPEAAAEPGADAVHSSQRFSPDIEQSLAVLAQKVRDGMRSIAASDAPAAPASPQRAAAQEDDAADDGIDADTAAAAAPAGSQATTGISLADLPSPDALWARSATPERGQQAANDKVAKLPPDEGEAVGRAMEEELARLQPAKREALFG